MMNFGELVERLVPLTAELFATLASKDPLRMRFADIGRKTVRDIYEMLRRDGMSNQAIAASLDMTINGFRARVARDRELFEEGPSGQPTLIERVYAFIAENGSELTAVNRAAIERAFRGTPDESLRAVLHYLVESGKLSTSGRGTGKQYRLVPFEQTEGDDYHAAQVMLFHHGPLSIERLAESLNEPIERGQAFLKRLSEDDRVVEETDEHGSTAYRVGSYHIPLGEPEGFEAALLDHVNAVFQAIGRRVRGTGAYTAPQYTGGTTYAFDVPADDPLAEEIGGFLTEMREKMPAWLERSEAANTAADADVPRRRISIYTGQTMEDLS